MTEIAIKNHNQSMNFPRAAGRKCRDSTRRNFELTKSKIPNYSYVKPNILIYNTQLAMNSSGQSYYALGKYVCDCHARSLHHRGRGSK